jgi:hypothetical protein
LHLIFSFYPLLRCKELFFVYNGGVDGLFSTQK